MLARHAARLLLSVAPHYAKNFPTLQHQCLDYGLINYIAYDADPLAEAILPKHLPMDHIFDTYFTEHQPSLESLVKTICGNELPADFHTRNYK